MKKIILERGKGKTTELIKISSETGDYIVCASIDEAAYIQSMANELGLRIPLPITYNEFLKGYYGRQISGFLIDNVERLLYSISDKVNAVTLCA